MPSDPWVAIITMTAVILMAVGFRGFLGRIAVFLGLIFGYLLSWLFDAIFGQTSLPLPGNPEPGPHDRVDWDLGERRRLVRLPLADRRRARRQPGLHARLRRRAAGTSRRSR